VLHDLASEDLAAQSIARGLGAPPAAVGLPENVCFPQVTATGALRIETTWAHETGADGAPHVTATGSVDNRPTPESLRRRQVWETTVLNELFPEP